jgi:hypothetical protein
MQLEDTCKLFCYVTWNTLQCVVNAHVKLGCFFVETNFSLQNNCCL